MDSSFDLDLPPPAPPCSGCFEALPDQFRLRCHHTLCQPCLQHSKIQDKVECPECEHITPMAEVEETDRVANETLDESYLFSQDEADQSYSSMMSNVGYVTTECGGCQIVKMVTVKCLNCNKCMCAECRVLHKQVMQNRSHVVESVEEVIRKVQMDLDDMAPQLEEREEAMKLKLYGETRFIDELKNIERKVIDEINLYREELKRQVDDHHDHLIHRVHEISEMAVLLSNERKDTINRSIEDISESLKLVNDLTTGMEFSYLLQDGRTTHEDILKKMKAVDERLNSLKEASLPSMSVISPKPWVGNRVGTSLQTDTNEEKDDHIKVQRSTTVTKKDNTKNDKHQEGPEISKLQRHQSLDSGSRRLMIPNDHTDVQLASRLQRFQSLDSLNSQKAPKMEALEIETMNVKRSVNIQDIIERLQKCATPKKHDTSPRDLPRRSQSFTTTIKPALRESPKLDYSPSLTKSEPVRRSQSFTNTSNRGLTSFQKQGHTAQESISVSKRQPSHDTLQMSVNQVTPEKEIKEHPVYTPRYTTKATPSTQSHPKESATDESKQLSREEHSPAKSDTITFDQEKEKKPVARSQSFTHKNTHGDKVVEGRQTLNRRLSDPNAPASSDFNIKAWGSLNSISAASETSLKSYSSFSDLSDIDGYLTPRSGLQESANISQINLTPRADTERKQGTSDDNGQTSVNPTSTPVSNKHPTFPGTTGQVQEQQLHISTSDSNKDTHKFSGPKKISSDQIRNMVNSMVSPRKTGNTTPPSGLKSVPLLSPRRLNTGYQTGPRKGQLGTPRSYSTGVIHTITETDQDVENQNVFEGDSKTDKSKLYGRSMSLNTKFRTNGESTNVLNENREKTKREVEEESRNAMDQNGSSMVDPSSTDRKQNQELQSPSSPGKLKGILKQSKDSNRDDMSEKPTYPEVRTTTEEVIEKPRHTIHSPRMSQQQKADHNGLMLNTVQPISPRDVSKTSNGLPKKLSINIPVSSDTENEDNPTETIKNSPRFMDIFHQLNGNELSEPTSSDMKSPRRVHVLKSQVKFVEEEKQKMKARKVVKSNDRRLANGPSIKRVPSPGLLKTMPTKVLNNHHNGDISRTNGRKTERSTSIIDDSTNGVTHDYISSNNCCENDFTKMEEIKYIIEGLSQLPFRPYRVYMIDSALWCSALSGLHLYDINCKFIKSIKHPNLRHCRAIVKTAPNEIVVGCADKYGLISLDLNGEFKSQIISGCFPSVNWHRQQLFALEFERNEILVFGMEKKGWQGIRTIALNYTYNCSPHDIMLIHDDGTMYMSCWNENCLLQFDSQGNLLASCGQYGQGEAAGRLYDPRLCKLDIHGNAVVADYWNQRMQVCTKDGEWSLVDISGDLGLALDAVVDSQLETIWLIARDNKLMKFTVVE